MTRLKIYGERNSGTNYVERLIRLNLDVEILRGVVPEYVRSLSDTELARDVYFRMTYRSNLGWKHAMAPSARRLAGLGIDDLEFATVTKNPYAWLRSLHRRPYHACGDVGPFESFLTSPWKTRGRDNHRGAFSSPVQMWNEKNRSYLALGEVARVVNIRYEDVLEAPGPLIDTIGEVLSLPRRSSEFRNLSESTKERGKDFEHYRRYYLQKQWLDGLESNLLHIINERLDHDLASRLGYGRET